MSMFRMAQGPLYDQTAVQPMRDELKAVGITELLTPDDVDTMLGKGGTAIVVVNSVCGCAAGNARPGVMIALQNDKIPDHLTTVFAGQEREAVERARSRMEGIPPSSPCIALFKDGKVVHVLQRHDIENRSARQVADSLIKAFNEHCGAKGPSIPPAEFNKLAPVQMCGSSIPMNH